MAKNLSESWYSTASLKTRAFATKWRITWRILGRYLAVLLDHWLDSRRSDADGSPSFPPTNHFLFCLIATFNQFWNSAILPTLSWEVNRILNCPRISRGRYLYTHDACQPRGPYGECEPINTENCSRRILFRWYPLGVIQGLEKTGMDIVEINKRENFIGTVKIHA